MENTMYAPRRDAAHAPRTDEIEREDARAQLGGDDLGSVTRRCCRCGEFSNVAARHADWTCCGCHAYHGANECVY